MKHVLLNVLQYFSERGGGVGGNDVGVLPHLKTVQKPETVLIIVRERNIKI